MTAPQKPPEKQRAKLTPLKTMERIVRLLNDLTPPQRKRVLDYVNAECAEQTATDPRD